MHLRVLPTFTKSLFAKNSAFASQVPKFIKFDYEDGLNLKSLLTKDELEVPHRSLPSFYPFFLAPKALQ